LGVILCNDVDNFGTLEVVRARALGKNIPFLIGPDIIKALQGSGIRYYQGFIKAPEQYLSHLKVPKTSTILC
jgi:hypothetical protein